MEMGRDAKETNTKSTNANRDNGKSTQRQLRNRNRGSGEVADWDTVSAELLREVIAAVTGRQCAIQFGYTRDGSAYVVRIVGDGEPYNEFIRPTEDLGIYLQGLRDDFRI